MSSRAPAPIVVFGGSFNPPTVAHSLIVSYLLSVFPEHYRIMVMPAFEHAHSKELIQFWPRLQMTRMAMRQFDKERMTVSNFEAIHKPKNTFEMLTQLKKANDQTDIYFIVGADCYRDRATWHRWDDLQEMATFCVIGRGGVDVEDDSVILPITMPEISSSMVREELEAGTTALLHLVDQEVLILAQQHWKPKAVTNIDLIPTGK